MKALFKKITGGSAPVPKTQEELDLGKKEALTKRKFGGLVVRFNPEIKECDKAGERFIVNDDYHPIPFETPFFIGRMVIRVKNAENAPDTKYWEGKARKFSIQVQGRFKERICASRIKCGSFFKRKILAPWGSSVPMKILCAIDPSLRHDIFAEERPWVASPLICAVEQCVVEPLPADKSNKGLGEWKYGGNKRVVEDSHLFIKEELRATTKKMGFKERCHYFAKEKVRDETYFETNLLYNFDFLSSRVDFNNFSCVIGPFRKSMAPYMNRQPFDFRACVYDTKKCEKVIGHLFAIEYVIDALYGEVAKETATPEDAEELDINLPDDPTAITEAYDAALGLSPQTKSMDSPAEDKAPELPGAELGRDS